MTLSLSLAKKISNTPKQVGVIFVQQGNNKLSINSSHQLKDGKRLLSKINKCQQEDLFSGKTNETLFFRDVNIADCSHILYIGIGNKKELSGETLRQVSATILQSFQENKYSKGVVFFDTIPLKDKLNSLQSLSEGLVLSSYVFDELKEKPEKTVSFHIQIYSSSKTKSLEKTFESGSIIGQFVNFSRRLGDMPGNRMTPTILSNEVTKAAKDISKLKITVWNKARIKKEKMNSFLSVSLGSAQEPKMIVMEYNGAAASKRPIAFVGKGLTFDCGGISIKPSPRMSEMKFDMCGGANVIGAVLAIASLKLKVNIRAYIPASENMPGAAANKPGDIVRARNGKTIEINNTDAEGRLILADALVYACEQKPQMVVDAATLTGAMVVALGNTHTGFFTHDDKLAKRINTAAQHSKEPVWRMPLVKHHLNDVKGHYADLSNISSFGGAGSSTAAAFLSQFVDEKIPWAHFDIAGTGWDIGNRSNYNSKKGASGSMIRTFIELAKSFSN